MHPFVSQMYSNPRPRALIFLFEKKNQFLYFNLHSKLVAVTLWTLHFSGTTGRLSCRWAASFVDATNGRPCHGNRGSNGPAAADRIPVACGNESKETKTKNRKPVKCIRLRLDRIERSICGSATYAIVDDCGNEARTVALGHQLGLKLQLGARFAGHTVVHIGYQARLAGALLR